MSNIQLIRIDDRLIHGQVVIGWANYLNSNEIILCDDSVNKNDWEKELYLSIVPENINAKVFGVEEMADYLLNNNDLTKSIIVVSSPHTIQALSENKIPLKSVNIGGIHFKDGRKKYLPYLYLNEDEVRILKNCVQRGIDFHCQDMPENKKHPLNLVLNNN